MNEIRIFNHPYLNIYSNSFALPGEGGTVLIDSGLDGNAELFAPYMDGEKVYVRIIAGEGCTFEVRPCELMFDGHRQETARDNSDCRKLTICFDDRVTELEVAFAPMPEKKTDRIPAPKPFCEW